MENEGLIGCIFGVWIACCLNLHSLETILKLAPSCANVITFIQFLLIAIYELIFTSKFLSVVPHIPISRYFGLVILFFLVSSLNNMVLNLDIPITLHMIFRSGSLPASMLMGRLWFKRRYSYKKLISIFMVSLGLLICTYFSSPKNVSSNENYTSTKFILGVSIMIVTLFLGACMGAIQESLCKNYGSHPREMLFYTHFLALPLFTFMFPNLGNEIKILMSTKNTLNIYGVNINSIIFWLTINVITQYICVRFVYILTTICTSLTITLVTTVRRFISLTWSIYRFKNPFNSYNILGSIMVFIGTILYVDLQKPTKKNEKKIN